MNQSPPIVLECPECGEKYLISRESYSPSEKAILYSDGYVLDTINWRTPSIIGCITCELGFFPENGKKIAEPNWEEFNEKWADIKQAEPPSAGSLVLELRARKNMYPNAEKALRTELWYAGNHTQAGKYLLSKNEKFKIFWIESLSKLEGLLVVSNENELFLKAEINRQLMHFDSCISLLTKNEGSFAQLIIQQAKNQNEKLFEIF